MKSTVCWRKKLLSIGMIVSLMLCVVACGAGNGHNRDGDDPTEPWTVTATEASWLTTNPFDDKHDGGWVYSAREDCLYAIYGNDSEGQRLYRIDHIDETSTVATVSTYNRHGSQPVIDDTGTYIYLTPSESTVELERYNTETSELELLAPAPDTSTYSHGAWKNGKLWIVLDDNWLYSYDPDTDTWSGAINDYGAFANVATSGPGSNLIYILADGGDFYSYDVTTDTVTTLDSHPFGFDLGGNGELTWFGASVGFIYACDGSNGYEPAIYDISTGTWHELSDPKINEDYDGHATYDSSRHRLYVAGSTDGIDDEEVWYYQF